MAYAEDSQPPTPAAAALRGLVPKAPSCSRPPLRPAPVYVTAEEVERKIEDTVRRMFAELGKSLCLKLKPGKSLCLKPYLCFSSNSVQRVQGGDRPPGAPFPSLRSVASARRRWWPRRDPPPRAGPRPGPPRPP